MLDIAPRYTVDLAPRQFPTRHIQKREESLRESEPFPRLVLTVLLTLGQLPLGTDSRVCTQTRYS
jgi:hypothetical protein